MADTICPCIRGNVQGAVKLMGLNSDQRKKRWTAGVAKQFQVISVRLDVFVDRKSLDRNTVDRLGSHAPQVRNSTVRHEAAPEALDISRYTVLAWFYDDDAKHRLMISPKTASVVAFRWGSKMLHEYMGKRPKIGERVFLAEGAEIAGDVEIGDDWSFWFNSVVRGDSDMVRIGKYTNFQDCCVGHTMRNQCPLILGDYVTIGHGAVLHGCTVESHSLIGMRVTLLNNVSIGTQSIVAAGAVVTEGTIIPPRSLVMGLPAKVKRALTESEIQSIDDYAQRYYQYKENYLRKSR
jgi:carbonic anhydrase/acetyltransferase-like protein (isoleucine patch superfamily)